MTNNNAHSWVEVYFPEQGWVTFEPTKGFTNPAEFTSTDTKDSGAKARLAGENKRGAERREKTAEKEEKQKDKREPVGSEKSSASHANAGAGWYVALALLAVLLLARYCCMFSVRYGCLFSL